MRLFKIAGVFCLLFLALTCSAAVTIDVNTVSGAWNNVAPGSGIVVNNVGSPITLRWGVPIKTNQSGYDFSGAGGLPVTVPENTWFQVGTFVHHNNPITGTTLSSVDLDITLGMTVPTGGSAVSKLFTYGLTHTETPNSSPCTGLGLPEPSVSVCDDLVTITNPTPNQTFNIGGVDYTLKLGFSKDGGATILSYFQTQEETDNSAGIYGKFTTEVVPEPGFYGALAMGLAGLYCAIRRRRSA